MKEPGCLALGRRGPSALAVKYPGEGSAGKRCIMPSAPLNQRDLFAVVCRCSLTVLLKKNWPILVITGPEKNRGFYMVADCCFFLVLKK